MNYSRILFVRHGRTEWNATFRYQGRTDVPCNDEGIDQGHRVALRLKSWRPEVVYTSPLSRARNLAEEIAELSGARVVPDERITEYDFGEWEGLSTGEIIEQYGSLYDAWRKDPFVHMPPGAEPMDAFMNRVRDFVESELAANPQSRMVVVGHGYCLRAVLSAAMGYIDNDALWKIRMDNCSITGLDPHPPIPMLAFMNDMAHLNVPMELIPSIPLMR